MFDALLIRGLQSDSVEIARLRAALDEALEVVKPFSNRCDEAVRSDDGDRDGVTVKTGHLRAARRFYEKHRGGGNG